MGCCSSQNIDEFTPYLDTKKPVKKEKKDVKLTKILLLGAGESGKSTVLKQMRLIYDKGFKDTDRAMANRNLISYITLAMRTYIDKLREWGLVTSDAESKNIEIITAWMRAESDKLTPEVGENIFEFWNSPVVAEMEPRSNELHLVDSTPYFLDNVVRISQEDFVPNDEDVLHVTVRTCGIEEYRFSRTDIDVCLIDVGGQRSERRKWIHYFEGVTAIIFCVSLSSYDLTLYEDPEQNQLLESLDLFQSICASPWFTTTHMILFLNKKDLLRKKLKLRSLKMCFPDYEGGDSYSNARSFIKSKFQARNMDENKMLYCCYTCATDTSLIDMVFCSVIDILVNNFLTKVGLL